MDKEQKAATIEEIAAQIEGAAAIFAVDYRGISVPQAAELRGKLREADASFRVVKNRLTKLAAEKAGEDRLGELLEGPTALTFVRGDTALAAKAISTFNKEHEILNFKGGFMDGVGLDEDRFKSIARLPSREVLNGQFAGMVASPLTGLVRGLGSMIQGLALQLGQIAEKGLVSGEAAAPSDQGEDSSEEASKSDPSPPSEEAPETEQSSADPSAPGREAEAADGNDAEAESPGDETSEKADEAPAGPGREAEEPAVDGDETSDMEKEKED
jgi:large subunit ribosomal protein L10